MDTTVRIHNRNKFEHKEMYQGRTIIIPANDCIKLDYEEAQRFLGQMFTPKFDKGGVQVAQSFKWLEMDQADKKRAEAVLRNEEDKSEKVFVCMACSKEFATKKSLIAHSKKEHSDSLVGDPEKDD